MYAEYYSWCGKWIFDCSTCHLQLQSNSRRKYFKGCLLNGLSMVIFRCTRRINISKKIRNETTPNDTSWDWIIKLFQILVEDCLKRIYFYRNRFRRRLRNRFSKPPQDLDLLQKKKRFDKGSDNSSNLFCCVRTCESLKRREPLPIVVAEGSFKYVGLIVARFRGVHGSERISIGRLVLFCGCKKHWDSIKQT